MSAKARDRHGKWRSKTVSFNASPEEQAQISAFAALAGMTKQDYCLSRLLQRDVVVSVNPRVHKALKNQMEQLIFEFRRITDISELSPYTLEVLDYLIRIYDGMKSNDMNQCTSK